MKKIIVLAVVFFLGSSIQIFAKSDFPWEILMPAISAAAQQNVEAPKNVEVVQVTETWSGESVPALLLSFDSAEVNLENLYGYLEIKSPSTGSGMATYILEGEEVQVWMPPGIHNSLRIPEFFLFKGRWTTFIPLSYMCEDFSRTSIAAKDFYEENEWYPDLTKLSIGNGVKLVCTMHGCYLSITACAE